jgi:thiamine pyrophosphate-dependent acetolactate synthase large subunit-like protein
VSATVSDHLLERLVANGVHRVHGCPGEEMVHPRG